MGDDRESGSTGHHYAIRHATRQKTVAMSCRTALELISSSECIAAQGGKAS